MHNLPFDKPGRFWKGNIHTHSDRSDGTLPVDQLIEAYRSQGYDFLAVTDHFMERFGFPIVDTRQARSEYFTTIIGAELHAPALQHGESWHLLAVGLPLDFDPPVEGEDGPALARRAADAGAFLAIAHPSWYSLSLQDALSIDAAHAVETYNHTAHHHNDRGESWAIYEQLLMKGRKLHAVATDDAHFKTRPDYFGGWVMVRSESLDSESLVKALKQGHSYSTQGPKIHYIEVSGAELRISTSPARAYFLSGGGSSSQSQRGDRLVHAIFDLGPFSGRYCRVTIVDDWGRRAWTNAIWVP